MKKSQSLSINTIIVAALALVVFVILIVMFSGKFKGISQNLESCVSKQGECKAINPVTKGCPDANEGAIKNTDCATGQICCIKVLT